MCLQFKTPDLEICLSHSIATFRLFCHTKVSRLKLLVHKKRWDTGSLVAWIHDHESDFTIVDIHDSIRVACNIKSRDYNASNSLRTCDHIMIIDLTLGCNISQINAELLGGYPNLTQHTCTITIWSSLESDFHWCGTIVTVCE